MCVNSQEAKVIMSEVHEGTCSAHQGADTLSWRILLLGYYWPSMKLNCDAKVRACKVCQVFAKRLGRPATYYQPVSNVIPFARWGIDLIGPFPMTSERCKFVIVTVDYFTKWVEAEPLATIIAQQCKRFFWRNNFPVWSTDADSNRQWLTVQQLRLQGIPSGIQNQQHESSRSLPIG